MVSGYFQEGRSTTSARKAGIQGSQIDFLICSVSVGNEVPIFTTDKDFLSYKKRLPIALYQPRTR